MERSKRSVVQHKVEPSTLLKIVMVKKRNKLLLNRLNNDSIIVTWLATEAMEALKKCDLQTVIKNNRKKTVLKKDEVVFY